MQHGTEAVLPPTRDANRCRATHDVFSVIGNVYAAAVIISRVRSAPKSNFTASQTAWHSQASRPPCSPPCSEQDRAAITAEFAEKIYFVVTHLIVNY